MTRRKKTLLWLAIFVIMVAVIWGFIAVKDYFNNLKYKPVVNPNPQYFMTIHGSISPTLIGKVRLKWVAVYASSEAQCDVTYDTFEGIVGWRTVEVPYIAKPLASGDYSFKIPIDYYQPGYCKWQIINIADDSGTQTVGGSTLAQFYPCGGSATCGGLGNTAPNPLIYSLKARIDNVCKYSAHNILDCSPSPYTSFSNNENVPRNHNYNFIETYQLSE